MSSLEDRVSRLEAAAAGVASDIPAGELSERNHRVSAAVTRDGMLGCALLRVPPDYYSRSLAQRAVLLGAPTAHLCKTIVFEQGAPSTPSASSAAPLVVGDATAPLARQRYVAVIVQYSARIALDRLQRVLGWSSLAMAPLPAADALTGFGHNGMTPLGSRTPLPLVLARAIAELPPPAAIWLGGGDVDVKLRVFVPQLLSRRAAVTVADVSDPREEGGEGDE